MGHKPIDYQKARIEDRLFEKAFNRRKRDGVESPRKETDVAFAARAAERASKTPSISLFSSRLKKV